MPLTGQEPRCKDCKTDESDVWERTDNGEILCDKCYEIQRIVGTDPASKMSHPGEHNVRHTAAVRSSADTTAYLCDSFNQTNASFTMAKETDTRNSTSVTDRRQSTSSNQTSRLSSGGKDTLESKMTRKSARIKPSKSKSQTAVKAQATKGRSRRVIFKKKPVKAPSSSATVITSNHIFYKGFYWQVGDIVSVIDEDGSLYYAQIRGFLQDPYNEKSAVITWLVPTSRSPPSDFDASTYILGPEEDVPRKMEYFEFVCHAPSDYFHSRNAPYSIRSMTIEPGSVWTSLKAGIQPSFGSIASQDDFDHDSKLGDLKALSKTETGRRVRDLNRKQLVSRDRKLSKRELQHF